MMRNKLLSLICIILVLIMILSLYKIINWYLDNERTNKLGNEINDIVKITKVSGGEIVGKPAKKDDPFSDLINMNLSNVDFTKLKEMNSDSVAFIEVNGTKVSYPVVKTTDNDFYLYHSFDKSYNQSGWIFMDYRNNIQNIDDNTIIYAHGRLDGSMFGSLRDILTNDWHTKKENYVVNLSTEKFNSMWQIFSIYKTTPNFDYLKIDTNEYFLNDIMKKSIFNFNTLVSKDDKIITLSTCYDKKYRLVLHAKLIKIEKR